MTERERCAKIADNEATEYERLAEAESGHREQARYFYAKRDAAQRVAELIRSAPTAGQGE